VGAQRPFQLDAFRQHVPGIAPWIRVTLSTTESRVFTSRLATLCSTVTSWLASRIASFLHAGGRHAPLAGHFEDEAIDVGVERAAAGGKLAHRQAGLIMHTEDRRHPSSAPARIRVFAPPKFSSAG
jgi:hypothetical protein